MQEVKIIKKHSFKKKIANKKQTFKQADSLIKEEVIKINNRSQAFNKAWLTF